MGESVAFQVHHGSRGVWYRSRAKADTSVHMLIASRTVQTNRMVCVGGHAAVGCVHARTVWYSGVCCV